MVIRSIFRGGCYFFSGNKKVYFEVEITSLVVPRRYISRWKLLFSGNKKVYFEVVVTSLVVIRRYISRWKYTSLVVPLKSNTHLEIYLLITTKGNNRGGCYSLVVIRRYISRWVLLFSGNKKVYFEVVVTV